LAAEVESSLMFMQRAEETADKTTDSTLSLLTQSAASSEYINTDRYCLDYCNVPHLYLQLLAAKCWPVCGTGCPNLIQFPWKFLNFFSFKAWKGQCRPLEL